MGNGGIYGASCEFLNIPSIACIWAIPTCRTIPGWLGLIDPLRFRQCRTSARQATSFRHRDILVFYSGRSLRLLRCFFPSSLSSRKPNVLLKDIATMIKGALQWCSMPSYYLSCMCIYLHIYIWLKYVYGVQMVSGTENSCSRRKLREACVCTILLQIHANDIRSLAVTFSSEEGHRE